MRVWPSSRCLATSKLRGMPSSKSGSRIGVAGLEGEGLGCPTPGYLSCFDSSFGESKAELKRQDERKWRETR